MGDHYLIKSTPTHTHTRTHTHAHTTHTRTIITTITRLSDICCQTVALSSLLLRRRCCCYRCCLRCCRRRHFAASLLFASPLIDRSLVFSSLLLLGPVQVQCCAFFLFSLSLFFLSQGCLSPPRTIARAKK